MSISGSSGAGKTSASATKPAATAAKNTPAKSAAASTSATKESAKKDNTSNTNSTTRGDSVNIDRRDQGDTGSVNGLIDGLSSWGKEDASAAQSTGNRQTEQPAGEQTEAAAPQLQLGEGELLRSGRSRGENVTQMQEMLKGQGLNLAVDGVFGPETKRAVEEFQRQNNLKVDGIVGPETQAALNDRGTRQNGDTSGRSGDTPAGDSAGRTGETPAGNDAGRTGETPPAGNDNPARPGERGQISLADPNLSTAEQYEHYKSLIEANGGKINEDGATVLGLRGLGVDGARHDGTSNVGGYDDTFVVLRNGPNGEPTVQTFQGATHANQRSSGASYGPDANGNNVRGVAMLRPGSYDVDFATNNYQGRWGGAYHVKTQDGNGYVPAYRDTNADGQISASERYAAEQNGYQASSILFHSGKGAAPSSIGCQTITPGRHNDFVNAIGRNGFSYTLLDANDSYNPA